MSDEELFYNRIKDIDNWEGIMKEVMALNMLKTLWKNNKLTISINSDDVLDFNKLFEVLNG